MEKQTRSHNGDITYTLRTSARAKRLRVTVYRNCVVVVTVPHLMKEGIVERFIEEKADWLMSKLAYFKRFGGPMSARQGRRSGRREYLKHKARAYELAAERLAHFNTLYGFTYKAIRIKDQKTRWGSCSKKGNLNFSYKVALLPPHLADYIFVHELCHLGQFNHSKRFWDLVAKAVPDHKKRRSELKKRGMF